MCLDSPRSRAAWRADLRVLRVNISRTNATFSSDRDVDGRPFLRASVTEPVVRSFEWQCLFFSWRIVAFLSFTVRHHLCTATTEFYTSQCAAICARSWTIKRPAIFVAIARAASLGHCPHHRRANYKILFRDVYVHIIFIMIALILQNL